MDGTNANRRQRWEQHAAAAYERMFGGNSQEELVTLTEREDMAVLIAKELAAFLLEEHIAQDQAVRPPDNQPACPKCGQPGQRYMKPGEALPDRTVTTRAGDVQLQRERFKCAKCRILFFSAGCASAVGDGGLQSQAAAEGGAASEQGGVVRRGQRGPA